MKTFTLAVIASALLFIGTAALQKSPVRSVAVTKPANLEAAQKATRQAFDKTIAAQKAGEWDTSGHAQKARDLLESASNELQLSVEAAERNPAK